MKNLDWQLTNLELSKRLKELKVKQDGCFIWYHFLPEDVWNIKHKSWGEALNKNLKLKKLEAREYYSAFSVAELFEKMPSGYFLIKLNDKYAIGNYDGTEERGFILDPVRIGKDKNPANVLAKMLCFLIENDIIKL